MFEYIQYTPRILTPYYIGGLFTKYIQSIRKIVTIPDEGQTGCAQPLANFQKIWYKIGSFCFKRLIIGACIILVNFLLL